MANSLKAKLSKLRYKGQISEEEYKALIDKIDGHDRTLKERYSKNCKECILDLTDACSRGAGRAVNDKVCEDFAEDKRPCESCLYFIIRDSAGVVLCGCESWECDYKPKKGGKK